nr:Peptidase C48, SUMO/Sentrin/Ubl1 [Ipomoea batatas]
MMELLEMRQLKQEKETNTKLMKVKELRQEKLTPRPKLMSASNPPPKLHPKDQGKRPVVEYSPVRPWQRLSVIDVNAPINATEEALNTEIPTTIIDAWVAILNNNEEDRLSARLFASIWTTLYTVVNPLGDEDERYKKFIDSYLVDKSFAMETRWQNIQHQTFLFKFLSGLKSTYKANKIEKLKVKMMKMAWRDNRKKIDCGVFLMRHIETFRG